MGPLLLLELLDELIQSLEPGVPEPPMALEPVM
jgi:hypothetical protein